MTRISFTNTNNPAISLSAVINVPDGFDEAKKWPAIVVSPSWRRREGADGWHLRAETRATGLCHHCVRPVLSGESGGEPRQLENPYVSTEDVSAVIDHLTTLPYIDQNRIGAMGICAGAGYTANAAIQDRRIKAIGTVSAVNIGSMFRNGWDNSVRSIDALPLIEAGSNARTADAAGNGYAIMPLAPLTEKDAPNEELRQAWEYYHTPRAECATAPGFATLRSLNQIVTYDAYHMAETYLTQPIQIVVGSDAGSKWMSDDLYDRAASTDKSAHIVKDANHMDLYDGKAFVTEAVSVLAPFFQAKLA
ncbi:alpha/beta hydrolase [Komagataeibacter rhaeticus]|nr:alpha/beta hydrolase [Komagataeibacter rhaeticus]